MTKNNKKRLTQAMVLNNATYSFYYNWLKLICLNVFRWENLPKSVDVRYLELTLFERGLACYFYEDKLEKMLCLPVNLTGRFGLYGVPIDYTAYSSAISYSNSDLHENNSVLIWNNYLKTSGELTVQLFAEKLTNIDRTIDVNVNEQKTPIYVECSEQQRLTMLNQIQQYDRNEPYIWLDADKNGRGTTNVYKSDLPYVADKLETLKHSVFNDFLSAIGVENSNEDKKERLVSAEVQSGYGLVEVDRNIFLSTRQQAVEKINQMFPQENPVKVSFNSDVKTLVNGASKAMGINNDESEVD